MGCKLGTVLLNAIYVVALKRVVKELLRLGASRAGATEDVGHWAPHACNVDSIPGAPAACCSVGYSGSMGQSAKDETLFLAFKQSRELFMRCPTQASRAGGQGRARHIKSRKGGLSPRDLNV